MRLGRLGEDTDTSRSRFLEDAARRLSEVETRQSGQGLGSELADVLENAVKRALAAELSGYLTGAIFDKGVSLITAGLGALGIKEAISGLLGRLGIGGGGDGDGDGTGAPALTTPDAGAGTGGTTSTPALTAPGDEPRGSHTKHTCAHSTDRSDRCAYSERSDANGTRDESRQC